jgi:hypothetical protein
MVNDHSDLRERGCRHRQHHRANNNVGNNADNNVHVVPLARHPSLARCCCYARGLPGRGLRGLRGEIFDFDLLL